MNVPVVLFIYNRPDAAGASVAALRRVQPRRLFVVADGPKDAADRERCERTRAVTAEIDWSCDVTRLFADENLGCSRRISSGITDVLNTADGAIFMEDDCLATSGFFEYAGELLDRYSADQRVAVVSGDNFHFGRRLGTSSYIFSLYPHCWGWATWARAWREYDHEMTDWAALRETDWLRGLLGEAGARYWTRVFDATAAGQVDSWAYRWTYSCFRRERLTAIPATNLVANIGFGRGASHTVHRSPFQNMAVEEMQFPLRHPASVERDIVADRRVQKLVFEYPRLLWIDRALGALRS